MAISWDWLLHAFQLIYQGMCQSVLRLPDKEERHHYSRQFRLRNYWKYEGFGSKSK